MHFRAIYTSSVEGLNLNRITSSLPIPSWELVFISIDINMTEKIKKITFHNSPICDEYQTQ